MTNISVLDCREFIQQHTSDESNESTQCYTELALACETSKYHKGLVLEINDEYQNFMRIILLVYDASSFILKHIFVRELAKHGGDLEILLTKKGYKNKLKHKLHFGRSQLEKLFPNDGNGKTDFTTWDSLMLAQVMTLIFRSTLSENERKEIRLIIYIRNDVAHRPSASLIQVEYEDIKNMLTNAINELAKGFDKNIQEECEKLVSTCCSGPFIEQCHVPKAQGEDSEESEDDEPASATAFRKGKPAKLVKNFNDDDYDNNDDGEGSTASDSQSESDDDSQNCYTKMDTYFLAKTSDDREEPKVKKTRDEKHKKTKETERSDNEGEW